VIILSTTLEQLIANVSDDETLTYGIADKLAEMTSEYSEALSQLSEAIDVGQIKGPNRVLLITMPDGKLHRTTTYELSELILAGGEEYITLNGITYATDEVMAALGGSYSNAIAVSESLKAIYDSSKGNKADVVSNLDSRLNLIFGSVPDEALSVGHLFVTKLSTETMSIRQKVGYLMEFMGFTQFQDADLNPPVVDFQSPMFDYRYSNVLGAFTGITVESVIGLNWNLFWDTIIVQPLNSIKDFLDNFTGGLVGKLGLGIGTILGFTNAYRTTDEYDFDGFSEVGMKMRIPMTTPLQYFDSHYTYDVTYENILNVIIHLFDPDYVIPADATIKSRMDIIATIRGISLSGFTIEERVKELINNFLPVPENAFYTTLGSYTYLDLLKMLYSVIVSPITAFCSVYAEKIHTYDYCKICLPFGMVYGYLSSDSTYFNMVMFSSPSNIWIDDVTGSPIDWLNDILTRRYAQGNGDWDVNDNTCRDYLGQAMFINFLYLAVMQNPSATWGWALDYASKIYNATCSNGTVTVTPSGEGYSFSFSWSEVMATNVGFAHTLCGNADGSSIEFDPDNNPYHVINSIVALYALYFDGAYFAPYVRKSTLPIGKYRLMNVDQLKNYITNIILTIVAVKLAARVWKMFRRLKAAAWSIQTRSDTLAFEATEGAKVDQQKLDAAYNLNKRAGLINVLLATTTSGVKTLVTAIPKLMTNLVTKTVTGVKTLLTGNESDANVPNIKDINQEILYRITGQRS